MDPIFSRLGNLIRSMFQDEEPEQELRQGDSLFDTDLKDAEEELNEFLKTGRERTKASPHTAHSHSSTQTLHAPPRYLKQDYSNLGVSFGAPFSEVKNARKKLIRQYHPDKYTRNPEKLKTAQEITTRVNSSFQRIKEWEKAKGNG